MRSPLPSQIRGLKSALLWRQLAGSLKSITPGRPPIADKAVAETKQAREDKQQEKSAAPEEEQTRKWSADRRNYGDYWGTIDAAEE